MTGPAALSERFERLELAPETFDHRAHVEAAFGMLLRYPFAEAAARYVATVRTMAARAGAPDKLHVTVTIAYLALIAERMASLQGSGREVGAADEGGRGPASGRSGFPENTPEVDFDTFCRCHPDLLEPGLLSRFYSEERLASATARAVFLLPDAGREPR